MDVFNVARVAIVLLLFHPAFLRGVDAQTFYFATEDSESSQKPLQFLFHFLLSIVFIL